MVLASKYTN